MNVSFRYCGSFLQLATESPCHSGLPPRHLEPSKWNRRLCIPAALLHNQDRCRATELLCICPLQRPDRIRGLVQTQRETIVCASGSCREDIQCTGIHSSESQLVMKKLVEHRVAFYPVPYAKWAYDSP